MAAALNPPIVGVPGWDCSAGTPLASVICGWGGVGCNGDSLVTYIDLHSKYCQGTMPTSIGSLTALTNLNLAYTKLQGLIPTSIGALTALNSLSLNFNKLTGPIPTVIGGLTSLSVLQLRYNALTGVIPESFDGLTSMAFLGLGGNNLKGSIPTSFGAFTSLHTLYLSYNLFTGVLPASFCGLTFGELFVQYSGLSCYPACFETLAWPNLIAYDLGVCTSSPTGIVCIYAAISYINYIFYLIISA